MEEFPPSWYRTIFPLFFLRWLSRLGTLCGWYYIVTKHDVMCRDGCWRSWNSMLVDGQPTHVYVDYDTYHYQYLTNVGNLQKLLALVRLTRTESRLRCLSWISFFGVREQGLYVTFNADIENTDVSQIFWTMLRGETIRNALGRMERTHRFPILATEDLINV